MTEDDIRNARDLVDNLRAHAGRYSDRAIERMALGYEKESAYFVKEAISLAEIIHDLEEWLDEEERKNERTGN